MFLIEKFHQFHDELQRLTRQVEQGNWVFDGATPGNVDTAPDAAPSAVWRRLLALLERQSLEAGREGGDFAVQIYRGAQYAMAALADEVFLHLNWVGREAWREHLLEFRLFGSHRAGEEVFERIEVLLRDRDAAYQELARVYLIILALGFQGKFRGRIDGDAEIESYRRRLFRFVFGRDPRAVRGVEQVAPQAYASTLDESRPAKLPYVRPWLWVIAAVLVLWIVSAHVIWDNATAKLESAVEVPAGGLQ